MARLATGLTLAILAACLTSGLSVSSENEGGARAKKAPNDGLSSRDSIEIYGSTLNGVNLDEDSLLAYDPLGDKRSNQKNSQVRAGDNLVTLNLEREIPSSNNAKKGNEQLRVAASTVNEAGSPNTDRYGSIAFNSREVRLVGPNQKEVEMKDDMASKMVVVLDNLQKEATEVWDQVNDKLDKGWKDIKRSEVWGQMNDKLDKGWTDFKSMVEGVVSPSSRRSQQP